MPAAVLAKIGRRAAAAEGGRGPVIIGKADGLDPRAVIALEAERVGQPVMASMGAMMSVGVRKARRENGDAQQREIGRASCRERVLNLV